MEQATAQSLDRAAEVVSRRARDRAPAEALGLRLSHVTAPTEVGYQRYTPSLSVVLAGRKRSIVGDDDQVWGRDRFIITPVDIPVVAGVVETDPQRGFLAAIWQLAPTLVAEVAAAMPRNDRPFSEIDRLGTWSPALADAFARLIGLLDEPEHIPFLGPLIAREIVLRLLQTDQAPRVLAAVDEGDPVVPRAVGLLTDRMAEPWSMSALAAEVRTSQPTLFRRFKEATSMTPMQYLKRLRLGEARHRMVVLGESAAQAASAVGYRSAPHFSRDYRHLYGQPPAADGARLREQLRRGGIDSWLSPGA
ncbi:AraC family transcriptional regulator [Actinacidiphila acididurans]|uniref:AraC family transcriptional regulator n=1 Tax=Actinacidiphila acididurans TaxID=2784346 RepID=A0ABS2TQU5_9ACTN|nr:AraC family transcriptional regulator [Actinacidiphila acididurans]MBM9504338.1 AraC family transcriptional regulator [Actinacidiphila acididurans]